MTHTKNDLKIVATPLCQDCVYGHCPCSIHLLLFCSLQMHPKRDSGASNDLSQEPWPPATLHHADHGHNAQTGRCHRAFIFRHINTV